MTLIGNLTFWAGKLLLLVIFVMLWWSLFMTSPDPFDILLGLIILGIWLIAIYLGIRKGMKAVHGEDYIDPIERWVREYFSSSKKEEIPPQYLENNVPKKVEDKQEKSKNVLYVVILFAIIGIFLAFFIGMSLGGTSSTSSSSPSSTTAPTFVQPLATTPSQTQIDLISSNQGCNIVGQWVRSDGPDKYVFYENGSSMVDINGIRHHGNWIELENSGLYQFSWDFGPGSGQPNYFDDHVAISEDCNRYSLTNNYGNPVTAVRKNWLPQSTCTSLVTQSPSCSIIGKWTEREYQGSPVSGVYLQISPSNTIELFLNGQLHNRGTWNWTSNNKFQVYWMGQTGQSSSGIDTVTISSDCNTQTYISQRGERSIFVKM